MFRHDDSEPDRTITRISGDGDRYLWRHDACGYEFQTYSHDFDEVAHKVGWLCPRCKGHPLAQPGVG